MAQDDNPVPVPVQLPYFRDATELPGPLPTLNEIHNSPSNLSPRRKAMGGSGGVCCIRDIYLVKYGTSVTENEGNALLFIENHSKISTPRLYAMYRHSRSGPLYLVMEYIQGINLHSIWASLSVESKSSITQELRQIFLQMRSLNPPQNFIGGVCGGSVPSPIFCTSGPTSTSINGPFQTAEDISRAMALITKHNWEENGRFGWLSPFLFRHLPSTLKNYEVNFTHGDLHMQNIIVEKVDTKELGQQWRLKGILDWESAGWYPAYWEYASAV
ncbi:phosphotransferase family protein, partial [Mariannaea sp. PMI_226]